ncbi:hypothetical protein MMC11_003855 [Xylographa trunciseda]|nr:hypothetical protein [Xylographa trunciseda]
MISILADSVKYLRFNPTEKDAARAWPQLENKINRRLVELDATVKHLNDITTLSKVNQERQVAHMTRRHAPVPEPDEHAKFPIQMLPGGQNENFYGRFFELRAINEYLDWRGSNPALRTYTIYGRRGVGKTEIALQYAYSNPSEFEAIFWIRCETSVSLRQSFSDMAVALSLPGADRNGRHEENLIAVQKWLKLTPRRWLLIFDNAERESILKRYWPVGANGAILITSRKYYNFMKDMKRRGETVKPFNEQQSWDLLMQLLGPDWKAMDKQGSIKVSEENAARSFLAKLGGLALAIQQAANLIINPSIGGTTIVTTYELFKENLRSLPERQSGERSEIVHSLDTLWNMIFSSLTRNARDLLSVLSLLSPDAMPIDLFLPRRQKALDGKLAWCKQNSSLVDDKLNATLSSIITPPPALRNALKELFDSSLIKQEGRVLTIHRVVQEAMNYHSIEDLQASFDSAVQLVEEAFPKQVHGYPLHKYWGMCQSYIPHGAHLSAKFSDYTRPPVDSTLEGSARFVELLSNCAWYLYEISDYDVCLRVIETASSATRDRNSLQYAHLCNTAASCYYELNRIGDCRHYWEIALNIRETLLGENDIERSTSYHNMGNLESATENLDAAMAYFNRAVDIRIGKGDAAAAQLALTYLCIGRVHYLRNEFDEATKWFAQSEALFVRTEGADTQFMSHVHHAYGNVEYEQKRWRSAMLSFNECLKIALAGTAIHPITAAAYYSLGCVEFKLKHHEVAKGYLDKARAIAELRSPARDDGTIARILWKTAQVMEDDTYGSYAQEAAVLRNRAEIARRTLTGRGEGDLISIDENGDPDADEEEASYDALVPMYFR